MWTGLFLIAVALDLFCWWAAWKAFDWQELETFIAGLAFGLLFIVTAVYCAQRAFW